MARVRPARESEHGALEALQLRASVANPADREAILANPDAIDLPLEQIRAGHVLVAEADGAAVGFAAVVPRDGGDSELDALFVEPEMWGRGVGRLLVDRCCELALSTGSGAVHVIGNPHAEGFYEACGFEHGGQTQTRFGTGLLMHRPLAVLRPRIEQFPGMNVVGLHADISFGDPAMRALWQELRAQADRIVNRVSEDFISLRIFDPPPLDGPRMDARFEQWAAVEVGDLEAVPSGLDSHTVGGGLYAVLFHRGTPDAFRETAELFYGSWLPESPYHLAAREYFEVLGPDYRPDDPSATEHIWIPVDVREP